MDYVDGEGVEMLSQTWEQGRHHQEKRHNLFEDLSRTMPSLSRLPQSCIGSWTLDSHGVLRLSNRPLTHKLHQLENEDVLTNMNRSVGNLLGHGWILLRHAVLSQQPYMAPAQFHQ